MKSFGSEEYGNKDGFKITCCNRGKEGWIVPIHYHDKISIDFSMKITLEFRCICGNRFGATIHLE